MRKLSILGILLACCVIFMPSLSHATYVASFKDYSGSYDGYKDSSYDGYKDGSYDGDKNCGTPEIPEPCPPEGNVFGFQALIPDVKIVKEWDEKEWHDGHEYTYHYTEKEEYDEESDTIYHSVTKKREGSYYSKTVSHEEYTKGSCTGDQCTPWEMKTIGEAQLFMTVSDVGSGNVMFTFENTGPEAASITDIYFYDDKEPALLNFSFFSDILNQIGAVEFDWNASPSHLPGYNPDGAPEPVSADADPPPSHLGINAGEYLDIIVSLGGGYDFGDLLAAINDGTFVTGLHVQAFGCGEGSMSFINNICGTPGGGPQVPEPGTMLLLGTGLVGLAGTARRKRNK